MALFLTRDEDAMLKNFIGRVTKSPDLELEARWHNNQVPLKEEDFLRLLNALEDGKKFNTMKKEFTRKIVYNNNYFQLQTRNQEGSFKTDPGFFRKVKRRGDTMNTQYGFRVMLALETKVSKQEFDQNRSSPFFRDRDRTSFVFGNFSFDLTVSREGPTIAEVEDDKAKETYEVEIEYLGNQQRQQLNNQPSVQDIYNGFIQNLNYAVTIIQDSPVVIGNNERIAVTNEYDKNLLNKDVPEGRRTYMRSPLTKPIDIDHKTLPLLKKGYSVTEKADGVRMMAFVSGLNSLGQIYLLQHIGNYLKVRKTQMTAPGLRGTVLDGEFVRFPNGSYIFLIIDTLWINGHDMRSLKFIERLGHIQKGVMPHLNPKVFSQKNFHFQGDIYQLAKQVLDTKFPYETDGLIFTPINAPYDRKVKNIFKWKPHHMLTIDFLTRRTVGNPTEWKLYMNSRDNRTQLFADAAFPNAGTINVSQETNKKFKDASVIEYAWVNNAWKPNRSRPDKTDGNFVTVAAAVFSLILDPVTKEQITTGKIVPQQQQQHDDARGVDHAASSLRKEVAPPNLMKQSAAKKKPLYRPVVADDELRARKQAVTGKLRNFHNWIKATMLMEFSKKGQSLADFGSGKGGDILKWSKIGLTVEGFELESENVKVANDRLIKDFKGAPRSRPITGIRFHKADLSQENVQKILKKNTGSSVDFDVVTSFFGIHYFFDSRKSLGTFFKNVAQSLKMGGVFLVTTFDAREVFKLLSGKTSVKNDKFDITKKYDSNKSYNTLPIYGNEIVVKIMDTELRSGISEYLVKPEKLQDIARRHGLKLEKTASFDELFPVYKQARKTDMSADEKKLSFLNRLYVFRRDEGNSLTEQENMIS